MTFGPDEELGRRNQSDLAMHGLSDYRFQFRWTRPEIHLVRRLRYVEFLRKLMRRRSYVLPLYYLHRWRYQKLCARFGLTLPLDVFDDGLSLAHIGTLTVNADARVGRNCRLHPGVTIGSVRGEAPVIGDDVFIGPNAIIVGKIRVGDRTHIGPGVVVTASVPDDTVVLSPVPVQKPRSRPTWQEERLGLSA